MNMNKVTPQTDMTMVDLASLDEANITQHTIHQIEAILKEANNCTEAESLIKLQNLPISINTKRTLRYKLLEKQSARSLSHLGKKRVIKVTNTVRNAPHFSVWGESFKSIEGHFGAGVLSYFVFLRWLFFLNLFIFCVVFLFIVIPQIVFPTTFTITDVTNSTINTSVQCSANYTAYVKSTVSYSALQVVQDFLQGTGWMEQTILFYGNYDNQAFDLHKDFSYNMPMAYLAVAGVALLCSLIVMICSMANTFRRNIIDNTDQTNMKYSAMIFSSWDYTLTDEKNSYLKQKSLYHEFLSELDEERRKIKQKMRSTGQNCTLYTIRFIINFLVVFLLGAGGYLIYFVTDKTLALTLSADYTGYSSILQFVIEFLPSLTVSFLNVVIPIFFQMIVKAEEYRPMFAVKITIIRDVLLRLASIAFLVATLYSQILCTPKDTVCNVGLLGSCEPLKCWETYVGQNFYKLVITDFAFTFLMILLVEFPRKLIVDKCQCKAAQMVGYQEFDIPKNVLELVYNQTLCWFGFFFCPLIPGMLVVKLFIFFYMKKISALVNMKPSDQPYRASRSNTFFLVVLVLAYFLCAIPIGYVVSRIDPSRGCGPFRIYSRMLDPVTILIGTWPEVANDIFNFLGSAGFIVTLIVLLILLIYYYASVGNAFARRNALLKEQLILEGKDKQFLVSRLNTFGDSKFSQKKSIRNIVEDVSKAKKKKVPTATLR